jgi:SAM-dependent methyltransferase
MLHVAAEAARTARLTHVETCVMNAERLALDADVFDAVLCRLALMLFPQPARALTEMRRVVQPGGKVATMVYAALDKNPYHGMFYRVVRRIGTLPPPAPGAPWMYALGAPEVLEDVYRRAGLRHVSVQAAALPRRFPSAADALRSLRHAAGDLRALIRRLTDAEQERAWADMAQQLRQFEGPQGFEAPGEVLIGVGTK